MDSDSRAIIEIVLLFIASAYFALTETALASVSKNKVKVLVEKGNKKAEAVLYALDDFEGAITTLLICTNVAHIAVGSMITVVVTRRWGLNAVSISTIITTLVMFFFGEMLPKSIGKKLSLSASLYCDGLLVVLMKLLRPLTGILSAIGKFTLKITKSDDSDEVQVTEDEIYDIIEDMQEEGSISEAKGELISSALSFGDSTVSSILTPRVDIEGIDIDSRPEEVIDFVLNHNHSRVLIYEGSMDKIIGMLSIRKYLKHYIETRELPNVRDLMDEVYYTHQSMPIDELFNTMTQNKHTLAVVLDGFGGTLGIVTTEDMVEEIVGEIWDESDIVKEPIVSLTDNVYIVKGDETVEDVFEYIHYEDPDTRENEDRFVNLMMADWILEHFEGIPKVGDTYNYYKLKITVSKVDNNRILEATVTIQPDMDNEEEKS